jgi:hypothetical protein
MLFKVSSAALCAVRRLATACAVSAGQRARAPRHDRITATSVLPQTNSSYGRWWEARTHLGNLYIYTRSITRLVRPERVVVLLLLLQQQRRCRPQAGLQAGGQEVACP